MKPKESLSESAGAAEYTDCISADLCKGVSLPQWVSWSQLSWGCKIHQLHLCRGSKTPPTECSVALSAGAAEYTDCISTEGVRLLLTSILWPNRLELQNTSTASLQRDKILQMNVLNMILNNLMDRSCNAGASWNGEHSFIAIALTSVLAWSSSTW